MALRILHDDAQLIKPKNRNLKSYLSMNKGSTNWLEIS
jgi:hypothetical protein